MRESSQPKPTPRQPRLRSASPTIRSFPIYKEVEQVNQRINSLRPKLSKTSSKSQTQLQDRYKLLLSLVEGTSLKVDMLRYQNLKLQREIKELEISRGWFYYK